MKKPYLTLTRTIRPINGPLYGTTRVIRFQKGKTKLDARDSGWQRHYMDHMQNAAPRSRQITMSVAHPISCYFVENRMKHTYCPKSYKM